MVPHAYVSYPPHNTIVSTTDFIYTPKLYTPKPVY